MWGRHSACGGPQPGNGSKWFRGAYYSETAPFVGGLNPFHQAPPEAQLSRDREGAVSSGYLPHPGVY